ncbi:MAG: phycobilisome linker polypeptide [Cyanobacteriota bacterium]
MGDRNFGCSREVHWVSLERGSLPKDTVATEFATELILGEAMFGQSTTGPETLTEAGSRVYKIEYTGLLNPLDALATSDKVRRSNASTTVPYARLSAEIQRILRMGGKIVQVVAVSGASAASGQSNGTAE